MIMKVTTSSQSIKRAFFFTGGFLSLSLGVLGIFVPLLPTTCFILLAAYCFSRSSEKFHQKLITHPKFGPTILSWQAHRVIRVPIKCWASTMISISALIIWFLAIPLMVKIFLTVFFLGLVLFIWSCPHLPPDERT